MAVSAMPNNNPSTALMSMAPGNGQMPNQMVMIGDLLELAIKKTYRELLLLSELLPRKTDMERKIEIMRFANRNRQLYVRLLALVKWASSASKVEKCSQIVTFLDKQSMLFTETADILARLSREVLVNARLPSFQLLAAVEVLTLGTYSRLPSSIRDRLVPPEPISNSDKRAALLRLNHIIQQRLIASDLPIQMRNIKIEFGRVTFTVQNEFKLTLTLMGDNASIPWRVLSIKILVEDKEMNGVKDLVPPIQIFYLQNLIQSRLTDNPKPLVEAYDILHSFCLSLQLEVLHIQSLHLYYERLKDFIRIEEYIHGTRIAISYWKDPEEKIKYKLIIEMDSEESSRPLQIKHSPELNCQGFAKSMQANILSIEKLLFFTAHERSKLKLINLMKLFESKKLSLSSRLFELPAVLHVSFIQPCTSSEQLLISVDMLTGHFLAHIPQYEDCPLTAEIEVNLNKNAMNKIYSLILDLRIWITRERCKKTVEASPVKIIESLPFPPSDYPPEVSSLEGQKIYFQFTKHHDKCLMVVFDNDLSNSSSSHIWFEYYLLVVSNVSVFNNNQQRLITTTTTTTMNGEQIPFEHQETPKHFMKFEKVLHLDASNICYNYGSNENSEPINNSKQYSGKRRLSLLPVSSKNILSRNKKLKLPGYYITELAHVINFCDEKLAFGYLSTVLHHHNIHHQTIVDKNGFIHIIEIIKFPECSWCPAELSLQIQSKTLSCTIYQNSKSNKLWSVIMIFANNLNFLNFQKESLSCGRTVVHSSYDFSSRNDSTINKMVDEMLQDWNAIVRLYDLVQAFADDLIYNDTSSIRLDPEQVEVKSFSFKKITIAYGPSKSYFVAIYYKSLEKRFQLSFGVLRNASSNTNPHILVSTFLQQEFNKHLSIVKLLNLLRYTQSPLLSLQSLNYIPLLGVISSRPQISVLSFCLIPQSSTHVRLVFRNCYCMDIMLLPNFSVAIRDGAISEFNHNRMVEDFLPIIGVKGLMLPAVMNHLSFEKLLSKPISNQHINYPPVEVFYTYSQLERLLGASWMHRQFKKPIDETFKVLSGDMHNILFESDTMQFELSYDPTTMYSVHLWVNAISDMGHWTREDLDIVQMFFENRVSCAPYKPNAFMTFARILTVAPRILKDFIRLWKLDLYPDPNLKWSLNFCLTIPPFSMNNPGMSACLLVIKNAKILIFIQLTRTNMIPNQMGEPLVMTFPIVYDVNSNTLQVMNDQRSMPDRSQNPAYTYLNIVNNILKRFTDFNQNLECCLYPAILELMSSFQYPPPM